MTASSRQFQNVPIRIIASSTMVQHRVRCLVCREPVDHRVVFLTADARVLHTGCVPDSVEVPKVVLLQAIRRLDRMVQRTRRDAAYDPLSPEPLPRPHISPEPRPRPSRAIPRQAPPPPAGTRGDPLPRPAQRDPLPLPVTPAGPLPRPAAEEPPPGTGADPLAPRPGDPGRLPPPRSDVGPVPRPRGSRGALPNPHGDRG